MRTWSGRQILAALIYLVVAVVLVACLVPFLKDVLPAHLATQVGHNSEGYVIALIVIPWIAAARPRLAGTRAEWPVTVLVGLVAVAVGVLLIVSDLPSRIRTLNEGFIAAGLLLPYVQLRRPVPRALPWCVLVVAVLVAVLFNHNSEVTDLAEVWGALVLVPLTVDVFDRVIQDPAAPVRQWLRWPWLAVLVVVPVLCSYLDSRDDVTGVLNQVVHYVARCNEDFVAAVLISLVLGVVLGGAGRGRLSGTTAEAGAGAVARG